MRRTAMIGTNVTTKRPARHRRSTGTAAGLALCGALAVLCWGAGTARAQSVESCFDRQPPDGSDQGGGTTGGDVGSGSDGTWGVVWSDASDALSELWDWLTGGGNDGPTGGGNDGPTGSGGTGGDGSGGSDGTGGDGSDGTNGGGSGTTTDNGGTGSNDPGGSGSGGSGSSGGSGVMGTGNPRTATGHLPRSCSELWLAVQQIAPRAVTVAGSVLVLTLPGSPDAQVSMVRVAVPLPLSPERAAMVGLEGRWSLLPGVYRAAGGRSGCA